MCLEVRKKDPATARVWLVETGTYLDVELADWAEEEERLVDPTALEGKSCFVCPACARSLGHEL